MSVSCSFPEACFFGSKAVLSDEDNAVDDCEFLGASPASKTVLALGVFPSASKPGVGGGGGEAASRNGSLSRPMSVKGRKRVRYTLE